MIMKKEKKLIPLEEIEAERKMQAEMQKKGMNYIPERITIPYQIITEFALEHLLLRQQENYKNLEAEYNRLKQQIEALQQQPQPTASTPVEETKEQKNERMLRCIHRVMKEGVMTQKNHWQAILCILCDKKYYPHRADYKAFIEWMKSLTDITQFEVELNYTNLRKDSVDSKPFAEWKKPTYKKEWGMYTVAKRMKELLEEEEAKAGI